MADENPQQAPPAEQQKPEGGAPDASATPAAPAAGIPMPVFASIIGALLLIMLAGGFAIAYFVLPDKIAASVAGKTEHASEEGKEEAKDGHGEGHGEETKDEHDKKDEHGDSDGEEGEGKEKKISVEEFRVDNILVNIAGTRGGRFVKASLYFEASVDVLNELEGHRAKITDIVSQVLGSQTLDALTRPDARGRIRGELLTTINTVVNKGKIENIYFTDFIIQ